eukprot:1157241-Pelagomonas_calceolata.AAC.8
MPALTNRPGIRRSKTHDIHTSCILALPMSVMACPNVVALELEVRAFSLSEPDRMGGKAWGTLGAGLVPGPLGFVAKVGMGMGGGATKGAGCEQVAVKEALVSGACRGVCWQKRVSFAWHGLQGQWAKEVQSIISAHAAQSSTSEGK